ncbi:MAG: hypothetical protein AAGL23_14955 [Pseudomonadota bacterium]
MMVLFGALALIAGMAAMELFEDDSEDTPPPPEQDDPPLPEDPPDTGATFQQTDDGVELDLGEDETGSLAVIHYTDTEDFGEFVTEVDEARFYLVPPGTDWSSGDTTETQFDIPGRAGSGIDAFSYELEDFERENGLELLGTVDLLGVPQADDPDTRIGTITANAPVESYLLEANTDGDDLVTFLAKDFTVLRNGVAEMPVSEDTTGTDANDWFSTSEDAITLEGLGGDDILESAGDNATLLGGAGDDDLASTGADAVARGGDGDDNIMLNTGFAEGGDGNDDISITEGEARGGAGDDDIVIGRGMAFGGEGNDGLRSFAPGSFLDGGAGDDGLIVRGEGSEGFARDGDDFLSVGNGAFGYGGAGDDMLSVDAGGHGLGGAGDDVFRMTEFFNNEDGPIIVTTGVGADTISAEIRNAFNGAADDIYLRVTDFDTREDMLAIGEFSSPNEVESFEIREAADGAFTDIIVTYTAYAGLPGGVATIRLDGTTGVTADNIAILP